MFEASGQPVSQSSVSTPFTSQPTTEQVAEATCLYPFVPVDSSNLYDPNLFSFILSGSS